MQMGKLRFCPEVTLKESCDRRRIFTRISWGHVLKMHIPCLQARVSAVRVGQDEGQKSDFIRTLGDFDIIDPL